MRVKRCGYYCEGNQLYQKNVMIEWGNELGKGDAFKYSLEIKEKLGEELFPVIDVSSTTPFRPLRSLCPKSLKTNNGLNSLEYYDAVKSTLDPDGQIPGLFDFIYLNLLPESLYDVALAGKCFYDVFYNPDKKEVTVSRTLAILQLLIKQNKMSYLNDPEIFCYWYYGNAGSVIIINEV